MERGKVEFETIESEEIKFGKNNFLEISRKRAKVENSQEFVGISRGFFTSEGQKTYKTTIAVPLAITDTIADKIKQMGGVKGEK